MFRRSRERTYQHRKGLPRGMEGNIGVSGEECRSIRKISGLTLLKDYVGIE